MEVIKKQHDVLFTEKDLTDMYAEKVLNDCAKDVDAEEGYINYWGRTGKNGARETITIWKSKDFKTACEDYNLNRSCCDDYTKACSSCYYCAFFGKVIKKGVVVLIDAYAVEK